MEGAPTCFFSWSKSKKSGALQPTRHLLRTCLKHSEAWGPPQFQEKRSRSEKAILGALGAFRGILGATLGIRNSILGIRNSILGMASHHLSNTKTTILGATPGAIPGIDGNPHRRIFICPSILGAFFRELGWSPRARVSHTRDRLASAPYPPPCPSPLSESLHRPMNPSPTNSFQFWQAFSPLPCSKS